MARGSLLVQDGKRDSRTVVDFAARGKERTLEMGQEKKLKCGMVKKRLFGPLKDGSAGREYDREGEVGSSSWLKARMVLGRGSVGGAVRSALASWCRVAERC